MRQIVSIVLLLSLLVSTSVCWGMGAMPTTFPTGTDLTGTSTDADAQAYQQQQAAYQALQQQNSQYQRDLQTSQMFGAMIPMAVVTTGPR